MKRTGTRIRKSKVQDKYDVIVIGSGIGGLCTAALLAKLGQRVCVLEQHYTAGGYTHTYERAGYEWDVGVHYIGEVHKPWSMMRRVFDVISDSKLQWAPMDSHYDRVVIGDETFDYVAGRDGFKAEMKKHFPQEAEAIDKYVALISKASAQAPRFFAGQAMPRAAGILYNKARKYLLPGYLFKTTREVLKELTCNERLIGVLTAQWGDYGLPPAQSSFLMHAMVAKHYLNGGSYPVGGSISIAKTIIPVIEAAGGNVFTYAGVEEILIKQNRAYGVRLKKDGQEIYADKVVSCAGLIPTYQHLVPQSVATRLDLLRPLKDVELSAAHVCIYAGFKGSPKSLGLPGTNYWVYRDFNHDQTIKTFLDSPGLDFPVIYISFPAAKDPQWSSQYPDKSTVEIVAPTFPHWFDKWKGTTWNKRGKDYEAFKEEISKVLLETLYRFYPQLREALDFYELSTPLSTQWFQWNEAGEIYGIEHTVKRFEQHWIHPATPVKNLYLTGADVVTAGVGGALMGGVMTASVMLGWQAYKIGTLIKEVYPAHAAGESPAAIA